MTSLNIYNVVQPLHVFSKPLGLTSFSIALKNGKFESSANFFNILCVGLSSLWNLAASAALLLYSDDFNSKSLVKTSEFYEHAVLYIILSLSFGSTISNLWIFQARKHLAVLVNLVQEVDETLESLKFSINRRESRNVAIAFVVTTNVILIVFMGGSFFIEGTKAPLLAVLIFLFSSFISIENSIFSWLQFVLWMWLIKLRYKKVNEVIKQVALPLKATIDDDRLQSAMIIHDKLVEVTEILNRCYGIPTMITLAKNFAFVTLSIYGIIKFIGIEGQNVVIFRCNTILWFLIYMNMIYSIVHLAHFTRHEALKTAGLIHKLANSDKNGFMDLKILNFSQQLLHRIPVFSCGLFTFDLALAFKMISAATLYIIIFIQFEVAERVAHPPRNESLS